MTGTRPRWAQHNAIVPGGIVDPEGAGDSPPLFPAGDMGTGDDKEHYRSRPEPHSPVAQTLCLHKQMLGIIAGGGDA